MKYKFTVRETFFADYEIEANSIEEAKKKRLEIVQDWEEWNIEPQEQYQYYERQYGRLKKMD